MDYGRQTVPFGERHDDVLADFDGQPDAEYSWIARI